jgi:hypothetical protein
VIYRVFVILLPLKFHPKLFLHHKSLYPLDYQRGFVKGRNIFQGNRLLQDIIDYTEMEDEEGAIIFLDQQQAFDRVEWGWIDLCFFHIFQVF